MPLHLEKTGRLTVDSRIEPIPVGVKRYETEDGSPLLTIARHEGQIVR